MMCTINNELGIRRVSAQFVPKVLTANQKDARVSVAQDLLEYAKNDENFIESIITGDESWVYGYDPETKAQPSVCKTPNSPRPKRAKQNRRKVKTMLTVFFDHKGICLLYTSRCV